jgi:hypothetical protein
MNDLPENELLSAYLDGELSAAERAEVERLLAASPAARQLLDELRAVSATLQALPRRKLGEDLTPEVLRIAERRMLTEAEPERPAPSPAEPLARSIFRRFVNRRTLFWLSLTAAIAVMIKINERQERIPPVEKGDREVARAPVLRDQSENAAKEPRPTPTIQAAPSKPSLALRASVRPTSPTRQQGQLTGEPGPLNERLRFYNYGKDKDAGVLVVHCDISPEAAQKRAFDKLLDANGIAWHRQNDQSSAAFFARNKSPENLKQKTVGGKALQQTTPAGEVVVYAEATPAQIEAALAGLAAQPKVFLAVSIGPAQGAASSALASESLSRGAEQSRVVGSREQITSGETSSRGQQIPTGAAAPVLATQQPTREARSTEGQRQMGQQLWQWQLAQSAPRQQVVFVLRVIGGNQAAATSQSQVNPATDAAHESKSSSPPAASPAKRE